jgi:putative FmdB family regulatory protein
MPTYEYECTSCKHCWEIDQSIKDNPISECPKCKKETAKRLIGSTSFILSGQGWAKDNYTKK